MFFRLAIGGLRGAPTSDRCFPTRGSSGAIEQGAYMVMFVYQDEYYNAQGKDKGTAEVTVAKNCGGWVDTGAVGMEAGIHEIRLRYLVGGPIPLDGLRILPF